MSASNDNRVTWLQAETAIALFDAINEATIGEEAKDEIERKIRAWRDNFGTANIRYYCIELAQVVESVWASLPESLTDGIAWDFEWIPQMVATWEFDANQESPICDREKMQAESIAFLTRFQARFEFEAWRTLVNNLFTADYCASISDLGIDEDRLKSHYQEKESPESFVEWFAEKYDLTHKDNW